MNICGEEFTDYDLSCVALFGASCGVVLTGIGLIGMLIGIGLGVS